jgi:hypothetical protein
MVIQIRVRRIWPWAPSSRRVKTLRFLGHVSRNMLGKLAAEGGPPVYTLTPAEARNVLLRRSPTPPDILRSMADTF